MSHAAVSHAAAANTMRAGWLLLLGAAVAHGAHAEERSVSRSVWIIAPPRVTVRITLPVAEAARMVARGLAPPPSEKVAAYVLERLSVAARGTPCDAIDQGYDLGRVDPLAVGAGLYGFEIIFQCPAAAGGGSSEVTLGNRVLFAQVPGHIDFARIEQGGAANEQLFTADRQYLSVPTGNAGVADYLRLGARHLLRSADRLCCVLGLLLLARCGRGLLAVAAGLVCGMLAAVLCTAAGLLPDSAAIEAAIAFVVLFTAAQLAAREGARPRRVAIAVAALFLVLSMALRLSRGSQAAWLPLGFGLLAASLLSRGMSAAWIAAAVPAALLAFLDGLTLPGDYAGLDSANALSVGALLAFNSGTLLMCALLLGAAWLAARAAMRPLARDVIAAMLAAFGAFWLLSRLYA